MSINKENEFRGFMVNVVKHKRCKNCFTILKTGMKQTYTGKGLCSEWCMDEYNPPKIEHICQDCGIVVSPFLRKKTNLTTSMYPKRCNDCKERRHQLSLKKEREKKRENYWKNKNK